MNTLKATIRSVTSSAHLSSIGVNVGDDVFHLLLAEHTDNLARLNHEVILAFKETEVILAKGVSDSTANLHAGVVQSIEKGNVLTQVTLLYADTFIKALVPTITFDLLDVAVGDNIHWIVQPGEISLLRSNHGI